MAGCGVLCVVPLSCVVPVLFAVFPVFELDLAPSIVRSPLHCILSCRAVRFFFMLPCCRGVCGGREGGVCVVCGVWSHCECCIPFLLPPRLCVRCHSIVGLVLCLCDRVVSLWNSGGGLCSGRRAVWCEGSVHLRLFLFLPLPLPFCVGVRGSARAAMRARTLSPNTIMSSSPLLFFPVVPPAFHSPPFLLL